MPTEIEKHHVKDLVDKCRELLKPESNPEEERKKRDKQNYSHFKKLSPEDRERKTSSLSNMVKHGYRGGEQYNEAPR